MLIISRLSSNVLALVLFYSPLCTRLAPLLFLVLCTAFRESLRLPLAAPLFYLPVLFPFAIYRWVPPHITLLPF